MKRHRWILYVALVAGVAAFAWFRFATHDVPSGQSPLATLDAGALESFRQEFNRDAGKTRVVALLSPT